MHIIDFRCDGRFAPGPEGGRGAGWRAVGALRERRDMLKRGPERVAIDRIPPPVAPATGTRPPAPSRRRRAFGTTRARSAPTRAAACPSPARFEFVAMRPGFAPVVLEARLWRDVLKARLRRDGGGVGREPDRKRSGGRGDHCCVSWSGVTRPRQDRREPLPNRQECAITPREAALALTGANRGTGRHHGAAQPKGPPTRKRGKN